jgi:excisionase family DNA binding protein
MPSHQKAAASTPVEAPDLADWPERTEAAAALQIHPATLDRWVTSGKIRTAKRQRPGRKPAVVYNPADIAANTPDVPAYPSYVLPPEQQQLALTQPQQQGAGTNSTELVAIAAAIASAVSRPAEPQRFLTIEEASELTGLTVTYIRRAIRDGMLRAVRDGKAMKVRKTDLAGL